MKESWHTGKKKTLPYLLASVPLIGMMIYMVFFTLPQNITLSDLIDRVFIFSMLLGLVWLAIATTLQRTQKYKTDENGIMICFFTGKQYTYKWSQVHEISVCDVYHASQGKAYEFVIRIVVGEERDGPQNKNCKRSSSKYEKWRKEVYHLRNLKKIIVIEYSEEKFLDIKEKSKKEIKDYRSPYSDAWKIKVPN